MSTTKGKGRKLFSSCAQRALHGRGVLEEAEGKCFKTILLSLGAEGGVKRELFYLDLSPFAKCKGQAQGACCERKRGSRRASVLMLMRKI